MHKFILLFTFLLLCPLNIHAQFQDITLQLEETKDEYSIYEGSGEIFYNKNLGELDFHYMFYRASEEVRHKLIVLTPNIGGVTILERRMAHYLAKHGYHVLVPMTEVRLDRIGAQSFRTIENIQASNLLLTNKLIDYTAQEFRFDRNSIGLVGASLGGIRSSMLMSSDPRFTAMFISVAGADLPSIYAYSDQEIIVDIRRRHMQYLGLGPNDEDIYENLLRSRLKLDPLMIKKSPHLENIAMIIADEDTTVPAVNQWELWKTIKRAGHQPKTYVKDCGHIWGALWIVRYEKDVLEWMNQRV